MSFKWRNKNDQQTFKPKEDTSSEARIRHCIENDEIDANYGFNRVVDFKERTGYLINMQTNEMLDENKRLVSIVDYYFMEEDGARFKISVPFHPYFYILTKREYTHEVSAFLSKKYAGSILRIEPVMKEDLDLPNHLSGLKQLYLKITFATVTELTKVKQAIMPSVRKNREREKNNSYYNEMLTESLAAKNNDSIKKPSDHMENIVDIREYDVPYHVRVSIDLKIFVGVWYTIRSKGPHDMPVFQRRSDIIDRPDAIVLAFDIETTKLPLKFPDANVDQIMMISYMIDGQGFLITNREIISEDIEDFEYTPCEEFEGFFQVFNEKNESALLNKFFEHIQMIKPHIFVTYNGDFFDWPFVETRATINGLNMAKEIGFSKNSDDVYACRVATHMDCLCWVKRDSYLPVGSQGLKAVAKAKLRYDPVELDPEDMCRLAAEEPKVLSNYSVSDAVATYYLYMKYVHPFIFALCTIIPTSADEVLRKGSGTLCETLLMVEAFHANIIFPNKQENILNKMTEDGHVLDQETYVGGHVEALESGVFRSDIPCHFRLKVEALRMLEDGVEEVLKHALEVEEGVPLEEATNLQQVADEIKEKLRLLIGEPDRFENPVIYHLDVGAMYPNIILTNRLQPSAIVDETTCAACDFNHPGATCQRKMTWVWRGEIMPASRSEFQRIKQQLEIEKFPPKFPGGPHRAFNQLSKEERAFFEKKRLSDYCRKVYKKAHMTRIEERTTTICQKENSFYVDTVRAFRDRRYEYKGLNKDAKKKLSEAKVKGDAVEIKLAQSREVLYDSLQLAYKCILNSFYGYVMRKGSRWFSMEMGGIVCCTGGSIIKRAREIIEQIGRPLELDTDGIWCILPSSFPENFTITTKTGKKPKITISYANAVLNAMVKEHYTNHAYHDLIDKQGLRYEERSENSIFFEVDGPYKAMILPASKEEGKKLKKRYAVFNLDGSLAELKGFEVKRRGELQLIKIFQSSVFEAFLKGGTLEECYKSVATVADYWLDVLYSKGENLPDSELFELISENRSMSRKLSEYGAQKSTSISTAKRLAEFLGDEMVKDAGLACRYIISRKPEGAPVTERAIPLAIFQATATVKRHYLRKWLKDASITDIDIREVLDWNYYIERLSGTIQKIITIPAALQKVSNPVPRVRHPDWLHKKMLDKLDVRKQKKIDDMFVKVVKRDVFEDVMDTVDVIAESQNSDIPDIESMCTSTSQADSAPVSYKNKRKRNQKQTPNTDTLESLGLAPPVDQFQDWLKYQKRRWAVIAKTYFGKDALGDEDGDDGEGVGNPVMKRVKMHQGSLGGFLKKTQAALLENAWDILQVSETSKPGILRMWILVGNEMHSIRLTVPKTFYVNQRNVREEVENAPWSKCNRRLPRSRPMYNLYKFQVSEEIYAKNKDELAGDFSDPNVEGIYERNVTPLITTLVELGCICNVVREQARKLILAGLTNLTAYSIDQLRINTSKPYLPKVNSKLKFVYLYYHKSVHGPKSVVGLFVTPNKKAFVYATDSVKTNTMPNLGGNYAAERTRRINSGYDEEELPPEELEFSTKIETDKDRVSKQICQILTKYKSEQKGPTVLFVQTVIDGDKVALEIPALNEFPYVVATIPENAENLYKSMDWQRAGAVSMLKYYCRSGRHLAKHTEQCRYLHLPLGNVPSDATLFGADIFYARHLRLNGFVLWMSPTEEPDLGGNEKGDHRMHTEFDDANSVIMNNKGCYQSYCVELSIEGLPVTTVLKSQTILEMEGTASSVSFDSMPQAFSIDPSDNTFAPLPCYDESAQCKEAFQVLRHMVKIWFEHTVHYQNEVADFQIANLHRWIKSPEALLYDPAINRMLHIFLKKLFLQLMAEFKRLGACIIFADFNRIIICTKKRTLNEALGYAQFVVQSILNKELFHILQINLVNGWRYLMWLDSANYTGIKCAMLKKFIADNEGYVTLGSDELDVANIPVEEGDKLVLDVNWNILEFLPDDFEARKQFRWLIASYISKIHTFGKDERAVSSHPGENGMVSEGLKVFIKGDFMNEFFRIVQKLHKSAPMRELTEDAFDCPFINIWPDKTHVRPALEFVKAVCEVLSLDKSVEEEVTVLKRNLLRLIQVPEFAEMAQWKDPSVSCILPDLICKSCYHLRDLDLCKDVYKRTINGKTTWQCSRCHNSYDNSSIEYKLVAFLSKKLLTHSLQDLQCQKCTQIKMDNLSNYCSCTGKYVTLMPDVDIVATVKTFYVIAKYYKMPLLLSHVETLQNIHDIPTSS